MKIIPLICGFLAIHFVAFTQVIYKVYNNGAPINDYALIDLKYDPCYIIIENHSTKEYEYIRLLSFSTTHGSVYYEVAKDLPTDISGGESKVLTIINPYNCYQKSETVLLTLNITDYLGNNTVFHIYVKTKDYLDTTKPTFTNCPSDINVSTLPGKSYANVTYTLPEATDNCGVYTIKLQGGYLSGSRFPIGYTVISYRAYDREWNYATCSFGVIVQDNEPPELTCPTLNERIVESDENGCAALPDYSPLVFVNDNDGYSVTLTQSPEPGTIINNTTQVTIQAKDFSNNISECSFEVTLADVLAPSIENPGEKIIELTDNCSATLPDYTSDIVVADNHDMSVQMIQYPPPGTEIKTPIYITVAAVDDAGNRSQTGFDVLVTDNTDPEIICPADQVISVLNKEMPYTVQCREFDPVSASDNCSYSIINDFNNQSTLEGEEFDTNTETTITWTITDGMGNSTGCSFDFSFDIITKAEVIKENNVSVYPNPTNGSFTVYTPKDYTINIIDTKGTCVQAQPVRPGYNTINLSNITAGYYFIVFTDDFEKFSIKICKQSMY